MSKNTFTIQLLKIVLFLPFFSFSQDYISDTIAVRIILDSNDAYTLPVSSVADSSNGRITKLLIRAQSLYSIPPEIKALTELRQLLLPTNFLRTLPAEISYLEKLEELDIESNNISSLPPEIGMLKNLTKLNLYNNRLYTLPSEIGDLSNLTELNIHALNGRKEIQLPAEIGMLTNLSTLIFRNNKLTSLPPGIENFINLTVLSGAQNNITSLTAGIGNFTKLQEINFRDNSINTLPPEIGNLTGILHIDFGGNNLSNLPQSIVNLSPEAGHCFFGFNNLDSNNLSDTVIYWLDKHDPYWRENQVRVIFNTSNNEIMSKELHLYKIRKNIVKYFLPITSFVKLQVFDTKGRILSTPVNSYQKAGTHDLWLDNKKFCSGMYYFRLKTDKNVIVRKIFLFN